MKRVLGICTLLLALALLSPTVVWATDSPESGSSIQGDDPLPPMDCESEPGGDDGPRPPGDPDDITDGHRGLGDNDGCDDDDALRGGDELWMQLYQWLLATLVFPLC